METRWFKALMKDGTLFMFTTVDGIIKKSQNERVLCMNTKESIVKWWFIEYCLEVVETFDRF